MARLIDVDALLKKLNEEKITFDADVNYFIMNAPTVDAASAKRGRWIKVEDDYNNHLYECSYCHTWTSLPTEEVNDGNIRYCWSCGAKMGR